MPYKTETFNTKWFIERITRQNLFGLRTAAIAAALLTLLAATAAIPRPVSADPGAFGYDFVVSDDGVYTWYNDERAIVKDNIVYAGLVDFDGYSGVAAADLDTGARYGGNVRLSTWSEADDHNNPSLVALADGRIAAFYTAHALLSRQYYRISKVPHPKTIDDWGPERSYATAGSVTYNNAFQLPGENNQIFNFFRDVGGPLSLQVMDANGNPVGSRVPILNYRTAARNDRPYTKVVSNGVDRLDFFVTDSHPNLNPHTQLFHMYYQAGNFYASDGRLISALRGGDLPLLDTSRLTKVYDTLAYGDDWNPWNHQIRSDADGNLVAVFSRQLDKYTLDYGYARFDAATKEWSWVRVADAGNALGYRLNSAGQRVDYDGNVVGPSYPGSDKDYACGIVINPDDVNEIVMCSTTNPITGQQTSYYEMYRGRFDGSAFTWEVLTANSTRDNMRPYIPYTSPGDDPVLLWFEGHYVFFENPSTGRYSTVGYDTQIVGKYLDRDVVPSPGVYAVDVNGTHARNAGGSFVGLDGSAGSKLVTDGPTFTVTSTDGVRERSVTPNLLLTDFTFADGTSAHIDVEITGMPEGRYAVDTWHYDRQYGAEVDVAFFAAGDPEKVVVSGDDTTNSAPSRFVANIAGGKTYIMRVTPHAGSRASRLNGFRFELVGDYRPEPDGGGDIGDGVRFDVDHANGTTANGFVPLNSANGFSNTANGVTATVATCGDPATLSRQRSGVSAAHLADFVFCDAPTGELVATIANLPAGDYRIGTWHYDAKYPQTFQILWREAGNPGTEKVVADLVEHNSADPLNWTISSDGAHDYEIVIRTPRARKPADGKRLNAIEILPAPVAGSLNARFDVDHVNGTTASGFVPLNVANGFSNTASGVTATVTTCGDPATLSRQRTGVSEAHLADFVFCDAPTSELVAKVSGMPAGDFEIGTWHYDRKYPQTFQVFWRQAGNASTEQMVANVSNHNAKTPLTWQVRTDGVHDYEIVIRSPRARQPADAKRLNAIEITTVN